MHELLIHPGPTVKVIDSPIPVPNDDQVVIKVIVSGSNPKDWKRAEWYNVTINQGDDIAGIVHQVGDNVTEFKVLYILTSLQLFFSYRRHSIHPVIRLEKPVADERVAAGGSCCRLPRDDESRWQLCRVCCRVGIYNLPSSQIYIF